MPVSTPSDHRFQCIKAAKLSDGVLSGPGYALAEYQSLGDHEIVYDMTTKGIDSITFLFGLRGIGNHYRIGMDSRRNRVVLSRIRDGISIYLQHAYLDLKKHPSLSIRWNRSSIRLFSGAVCFINVLAEDLIEGRWGFAGRRQPVRLPEVKVEVHPEPRYEWIILGDGYSNNRWKNRDLQSWPELAFGDKCVYLNACVAAGNTRRTLEIACHLGSTFQDAGVIVAAGSDDFMENEPHEEIVARLLEIGTAVRSAGAARTHLCTLTPRGENNQGIISLNAMLQKAVANHFDSLIDFHHILSSQIEKWIIDGDYPGAEAQQEIARHVLSHLAMDDTLAPLSTFTPKPPLRGNCARAASKLVAVLNRGLGGF